jgi:hypothetical protein
MASKANGFMRIPPRLIGWGGAAALLLIPLVSGAPWTLSDYAFAAALLAIAGGTFELAVRRSGNLWYRAGVAVALATSFLLVWINGAVGIIGDEGNPANLMFLGVIATAIVGAAIARFEAAGMSRAMGSAALVEIGVGVISFVYRLGATEPPFFPEVPILIGFFALLWLLSAWLFRKAAAFRK